MKEVKVKVKDIKGIEADRQDILARVYVLREMLDGGLVDEKAELGVRAELQALNGMVAYAEFVGGNYLTDSIFTLMATVTTEQRIRSVPIRPGLNELEVQDQLTRFLLTQRNLIENALNEVALTAESRRALRWESVFLAGMSAINQVVISHEPKARLMALASALTDARILFMTNKLRSVSGASGEVIELGEPILETVLEQK